MTQPAHKAARVLIVDDHAIVRFGMGALLSGESDLVLCGEAGSYDEALQAFRELEPDVAVIDLSLHDRSGLDLIRQLREEGVAIPLLVLSMHHESTHAEKALRAGAQGYIMKEDADESLVDALRTVLSGRLHVSGEISERLLRTYIEGDEEMSGGIDCLTDREREIFECLGRGLTTRKIAEQFGLSARTVEVHRARIKRKLGCEDAAQVLHRAVKWVETGEA